MGGGELKVRQVKKYTSKMDWSKEDKNEGNWFFLAFKIAQSEMYL